ncbi:MAG: AAC(3) family N-acetyltransferase [Myxococcota bacterium]
MTPHALAVARLVTDLQRLGVREGDTLMVHASLRALGPVEDRAAGVIRALDTALGPSGTFMMVMGAQNDWDWVNERPEEERPALLANAEPFDALRTPAESDVSALAEVMRQTPGTRVSNHPEGRFGARGALAEHLLRDVPWNDYYGPGSPLERFMRADGKVLRLGADISTVTLLHYAEYLADVPSKRRVRRYRRVLNEHGTPEIRAVECLNDSEGIVAWDGEDYFGIILTEYLATGRAAQGVVGNARSELINGADLVAFGTQWMNKHLG